MPRKPNDLSGLKHTKPYVVFVAYPSSCKEYAYWCDIANVHVGNYLLINNAQARVQRIAASSPHATKWIPGSIGEQVHERLKEIRSQLDEIEKQELLLARWSKLKSPEAKKLVAEYKRLSK